MYVWAFKQCTYIKNMCDKTLKNIEESMKK